MLPKLRNLLFLTLIASSLPAQVRDTWSGSGDIRTGARGTAVGTITQLDSSRNRVTVRLDTTRSDSNVTIESDTATRYLGFEGAGKVSTGSTGFSRLRMGDRLEIRGAGTATRAIDADEIVLLGRSSQSNTGPGSSGDIVEGTIRSVRASDNTFVVETSRREIYEVRARANTPVYFEGRTFTIANLEQGDRVRVTVESRNDLDGLTARSVEVTGDSTPNDNNSAGNNSLSSIEGPITRIDTQNSTLRVRTSRGEVQVNAREAYDDSNRRIRVADFRVGDRIAVTGQYASSGGVFTADTVRLDRNGNSGSFEDDDNDRDRDGDPRDFAAEYDAVTVDGTVDRSWSDGSFVVRDSSNELYTVFSDRDFVVRTTSGNAISTRIKRGDRVSVRAFRDRSERYIAQGIRIR